jgi:hypothetical protein
MSERLHISTGWRERAAGGLFHAPTTHLLLFLLSLKKASVPSFAWRGPAISATVMVAVGWIGDCGSAFVVVVRVFFYRYYVGIMVAWTVGFGFSFSRWALQPY